MQANVLHVITGLGDGGAEHTLYKLITYDKVNTHTVVSLMDDGKYGGQLRQVGVQVHCLNMSPGKPSPTAFIQLVSIIRKLKPEVVQTWLYHGDIFGGLAARLCGVRNVNWGIRHCNLARGTVKRSTYWTARICAKLSRWLPRSILCCSSNAATIHSAIGYERSKIIVIPNGYDLARYRPDNDARMRLRKEWGISDEILLLGMIARFDIQKDHANLIAALSILKEASLNFHCVLVGTGMVSENRTLQQWINDADLGEAVSLLGRRDDIPNVMNAIDLHVLSSLGEAFPNVLAEAMACGTPCVTTDVGDASLIVDKFGWVVPSQEPLLLAGALKEAIQTFEYERDNWNLIKNKAREHIVNHFDISSMCSSYNLVWQGKK